MNAYSQSGETICGTNTRIVFKKEFKTVNHIIFGWDRFNSITLVLFVVLFCVWFVMFLTIYDSNAMSHGDHSAHEH